MSMNKSPIQTRLQVRLTPKKPGHLKGAEALERFWLFRNYVEAFGTGNRRRYAFQWKFTIGQDTQSNCNFVDS